MIVKRKNKVLPYLLLSVGPRADPDIQAVSPQVALIHPFSTTLPLLSVSYLPSQRASRVSQYQIIRIFLPSPTPSQQEGSEGVRMEERCQLQQLSIRCLLLFAAVSERHHDRPTCTSCYTWTVHMSH